MRSIVNFFVFFLLVAGNWAFAQAHTTAAQDSTVSDAAQQKQLQEEVTASGLEAQRWLKLLDSGKYVQSWQDGSVLMKLKIAGSDWEKALQKTRGSRGTVLQRQLLDHRVAYNPQGLPAGIYMAIFYQTTFSRGGKGRELLTMRKEGDGTWRVLTYHVTSEK